MDLRWTAMMTGTRDSGVFIKKGDGVMTVTLILDFRFVVLREFPSDHWRARC